MREIHPFDFQIQTTASDGKLSPRACVELAKKNNVHAIAITDHDTVAGIAEALAAGKELGVRIISGIEISIQEHGMHLLGLGVDPQDQTLLGAMQKAAENRMTAAQEMVRRFQKNGFVIEWADVLREAQRSAVVTRPHIASAIMKRPENAEKLRGITTKGEFFEAYFTDDSPNYVRASTLSPAEAISIVHGAGGLAIWSHPPLPDFSGQCAAMEEFLKSLIGFGLDGFEVFSPSHSEADTACLEALAERYKLLKSAGSDFHELYPRPEEPWPRPASTVGDYPTYGRSVDGILEALDAALGKKRTVAG